MTCFQESAPLLKSIWICGMNEILFFLKDVNLPPNTMWEVKPKNNLISQLVSLSAKAYNVRMDRERPVVAAAPAPAASAATQNNFFKCPKKVWRYKKLSWTFICFFIKCNVSAWTDYTGYFTRTIKKKQQPKKQQNKKAFIGTGHHEKWKHMKCKTWFKQEYEVLWSSVLTFCL